MLQVAFIRQETALVKERLAIKNFSELNLVDEIIALDDQRKKIQLEFDTVQSKINAASKSIGQLMAKGLKDEAEAAKQDVALLKQQTGGFDNQLADTEKSCRSFY